ncbi:MAG: ParA family protein [Leptospiraceae bacterium]|nr:ParA family protein [Leptospiraceae bacterium]
MGRVIALANQKGGVGKTTSAVNISAYLAARGKQVLLVDIDPQGNAGSGLGLDIHSLETSIYDVLLEERSAAEVIVESEYSNLSILPSNVDLSGFEVDMMGRDRREYILTEALRQIKEDYDFMIIDCPPNLGILTLNALTAAEEVIIALQTEYYALEGLTQLMKVIQLVQGSLNPGLQLGGVILTMFDQRTSLARQVVEDVRSHFGDIVFASVVPRNIKLSEAPSFGQFIGQYAPESAGAAAYLKLTDEVLARG